jgi:ribosomal protein L7/L12
VFHYFTTTGRQDVVALGSGRTIDAPSSVLFKREDGTEFSIDPKAFQMLRRAVYRENPQGAEEGKINLIKALRGLTNMGLRDAKEVAEYFMNNYSLDCGDSGR